MKGFFSGTEYVARLKNAFNQSSHYEPGSVEDDDGEDTLQLLSNIMHDDDEAAADDPSEQEFLANITTLQGKPADRTPACVWETSGEECKRADKCGRSHNKEDVRKARIWYRDRMDMLLKSDERNRGHRPTAIQGNPDRREFTRSSGIREISESHDGAGDSIHE
jgi:hypothetical protein